MLHLQLCEFGFELGLQVDGRVDHLLLRWRRQSLHQLDNAGRNPRHLGGARVAKFGHHFYDRGDGLEIKPSQIVRAAVPNHDGVEQRLNVGGDHRGLCPASSSSRLGKATSALTCVPYRRGANLLANHILVLMRTRSRPTSPWTFSAIARHCSAKASAPDFRASRIMAEKSGFLVSQTRTV